MKHLVAAVGAICIATQTSAQSLPDREIRRLESLEALAVIWGRVFLLQPNAATSSVDWFGVLADAIPEVERTVTSQEFATALNRSLFRHLADPAALAVVASREVEASSTPPAPRSYAVDGVAVIDLTDRRTPAMRDFPQQLAQALASSASHDLAVIDLRWRATSGSHGGRTSWLAFLLDSARSSGKGVTRERTGWSPGAPALDGWYTQRWRFDGENVYRPMSPGPQKRRMVIVVNNASIRAYEPLLSALQTQNNIAVIYERLGRMTGDGDTTVLGDVDVRFHLRQLVDVDGTVRRVADVVTDERLPEVALAPTARHALEAKATAKIARFDLTIAPAPIWPRSSNPTRAERLAGLMALWVVTRELNPHVGFASVDWAHQLKPWILRVEGAEGIPAYYRVLNEILATLRDGHTRAAHPEMGFSGPFSIPAIVMRVQGKPVVVEVAPGAADLLRAGDEILEIDGVTVAQVESTLRNRISARDPGEFMWAHSGSLRGQTRDSPVILKVTDGTSPRIVTLRRSVTGAESYDTTTVRRLANGIAYMNLRAIPGDALIPTLESLARTGTGLVLDLRGYPVLASIDELTARFIDKAVPIHGQAGSGIPRLTVDDRRVTRTLVAIPASATPNVANRIRTPTVLLVDGRAGSAAETIALQLQASPNVTIVGSQTVGVTGGVTTMSMPGGGTARFTGELMTRPDGSRFFGIGIIPDVIATPTIRGLRAGRDEVLEKAIDVLGARSR